MKVITTHIETPIGVVCAGTSETGIRFLEFDPERSKGQGDEVLEEGTHPLLDQLSKELRDYFSKKRTHFDVPLDMRGTAFQLRVWDALLGIDYGTTRSYMEQTKVLGDPKAIRAVASANGQNRIAIVVPCHRVIGSNGSLTGYAGEIWRKKYLLELESNQQSLF